MEKKNWLLLFIPAVFFIGFIIFQNQPKISKNLIRKEETQIHEVKFYVEKTFLEGVEKSKKILNQDYQIRGGIIPHDLFVSFIIADFFKRLSFQNPKTIIVIGPNHYEKGNFKVLTSVYNWETPYGLVNPDMEFINKLVGKNLLQIDEEVLPDDHAVSSILPFIKYYIRDAKVVPILLKRGFTESESEILATRISELINEDTVIIASVDFSHYLLSNEAKKKDDVTLKIMEDLNYYKLFELNSDYLDSPSSIGVLLKVMEKLGSSNSQILFHANSGDLQKNNGVGTTSYFSIVYK